MIGQNLKPHKQPHEIKVPKKNFHLRIFSTAVAATSLYVVNKSCKLQISDLWAMYPTHTPGIRMDEDCRLS